MRTSRGGGGVAGGGAPRFGAALAATGALPLRRRAGGFGTLWTAIVSQQVSTAAAGAIWGRLEAIGATAPEGVLAASDEALRAAGLSRQKVAYGRGIAGCRARLRGDARAHRRRGRRDADPNQGGCGYGPPRSTRCSRSGGPTCSRPGALALQEAAGAAVRAAGAAAGSASSGRWPRPGRRGGRWRRGCCGPASGSGPGGRGCGRNAVRVQRLTARCSMHTSCTTHAQGMHGQGRGG